LGRTPEDLRRTRRLRTSRSTRGRRMTPNRRHHMRVGERREFLLSASSAALAEPAQKPVRKRDYLPA
jgi:hypothetical protein